MSTDNMSARGGSASSGKKIILITGASSGMGKAAAEDLIKKGHIVYATGRNKKELASIESQGGKGIVMEMTESASIEEGVKTVINEQGRIDVLWNNAGYGLYGPVEEINIDKARHQLEVNLFGLARLTQLVLPYMRKEHKGLIINTSSMGGKIYTPLGAWYHASKHAVEGFSDCLRLELKEFNINVAVLEPGLIETGFAKGVEDNFAPEANKGAYKKIVEGVIKASQGGMTGSNVEVISETVQKIINTEKPKTRYVVGKMAKPLMLIRKWFGDKIYDRIIMSQMK